MEFERYDSSGTDDDLPQCQNRIARGGRIAGNGRSAVMSTVPYPRMYGETDMEAQIHQLEKEAYSLVLKAFKAQADAITWEKESLITELRKELRLSSEEHRELLSRVDSDDDIRRIREWKQSTGHQPGILNNRQTVHDLVPSSTVAASRRKHKIASALPSHSFAGPLPSFHPEPVTAANQRSSSMANQGPTMGPKGKKQKPSMSGASKMQYPPRTSGRGQFVNQISEPVEGASLDPLVGKKVRTRWPDDNNFYEAVITEYDPEKGTHCLVYDKGTPDATMEWVKFSEIPPEDIQWLDGPGLWVNRATGHDSSPRTGRGRSLTKMQSRKDMKPSQNGSADIRLLHTDTIIEEVERRVFNAPHPDPVEIGEAMKVIKEHEQSLMNAIATLEMISDDESGKTLLNIS
ncbi:PREDICTED: protein EMSY-LIKE 4-like isoform X1 [Ipomoea nil]|uniref:protein EMSY-LIKE 4-like isoform X1 n=1 Tax=Ipomoea nil TaxID=35883 RepID=UPI000901A2D1|nr:PREDICTED: protein EMSY-LIKE 4-like isoform X1 [Ipomoea nil]